MLFASAVATELCVLANGEHVHEPQDAVAHHVDFCGRRMGPANRNFGGLKTMMASEVEQFRVKSETFDALLLEDDSAALAAEGFKAALRVDERKPQNDAHDAIENDSGKFAKRRFVDINKIAVQRARADGKIVLLERREQLVSFFDRSGEIGIGEKNVLAFGFEHAVAHAIALAAVLAIFQ